MAGVVLAGPAVADQVVLVFVLVLVAVEALWLQVFAPVLLAAVVVALVEPSVLRVLVINAFVGASPLLHPRRFSSSDVSLVEGKHEHQEVLQYRFFPKLQRCCCKQPMSSVNEV